MKNIVSLLILGAIAGVLLHFRQPENPKPTTHHITQQETVLAQIRQLNHLTSVSFYMDSIVKTHKQGNWFALWQDSQTGLFVAKGRVQAGLDLDKLSAQNIRIHNDEIAVYLPPAQIISAHLDDIEVFDLKTGLFNVYRADWSVLQTVQAQAKQQILQQACQNGILQHAQQRSAEQIRQLFALTQQKVVVHASETLAPCRLTPQ
ncbi:DUF4230 domain-containing protein [Alysiella crassa]|uniref:DUF4230 domain-containing protein n=1 Tax=Alysiella crassa TaxID=153491 RepID=A0A376BKI5_9NEIS|nr:DUF4230 domain-containing protein [Alysiella crassa]UOP07615.1 DUF4230 domain-containing protein [Alysiella crassa]SSY70160.1 Uncharacterised protein [Alysiella crassa]